MGDSEPQGRTVLESYRGYNRHATESDVLILPKQHGLERHCVWARVRDRHAEPVVGVAGGGGLADVGSVVGHADPGPGSTRATVSVTA